MHRPPRPASPPSALPLPQRDQSPSRGGPGAKPDEGPRPGPWPRCAPCCRGSVGCDVAGAGIEEWAGRRGGRTLRARCLPKCIVDARGQQGAVARPTGPGASVGKGKTPATKHMARVPGHTKVQTHAPYSATCDSHCLGALPPTAAVAPPRCTATGAPRPLGRGGQAAPRRSAAAANWQARAVQRTTARVSAPRREQRRTSLFFLLVPLFRGTHLLGAGGRVGGWRDAEPRPARRNM